jgi:hypothetical protein
MTNQTPTPAHTVTREDNVTWVRWENGRERVSHPTMWLVKEDGVDLGYHSSKHEANAWIASQF